MWWFTVNTLQDNWSKDSNPLDFINKLIYILGFIINYFYEINHDFIKKI